MSESIFSKFDKSVDLEGLQKDIFNAKTTNDFPEIPAGDYEVKLHSLELKLSKTSNNPMVSMSFKILAGEFKGQRIFENKPIFGTKNDANMIHSVEEFLKDLDSGINIEFKSYRQFESLLMDIAEEIEGKLEYVVNYDPKKFFKIAVIEVFDAK